MERFTFGKNNNESICAEVVRGTESFVKDSRLMLSGDFLSIDLISKMVDAIVSYKDRLEKITPKNGDEFAQIKSALRDLVELEADFQKRNTLH